MDQQLQLDCNDALQEMSMAKWTSETSFGQLKMFQSFTHVHAFPCTMMLHVLADSNCCFDYPICLARPNSGMSFPICLQVRTSNQKIVGSGPCGMP